MYNITKMLNDPKLYHLIITVLFLSRIVGYLVLCMITNKQVKYTALKIWASKFNLYNKSEYICDHCNKR